jgi:hypothetical protein
MPPRQPLEVRYSQPFHLCLAVIGIGLVGGFGLYSLVLAPEPVRSELNPQNLTIAGICAAGLIYYAVRSIFMLLNRQPQVVVNRDGVWLGFGRGVQLGWHDIHWTRLKGLRPVLQLGITPQLFPGMRVSIWNLDDNLTAVQGAGSAVGIRGNGLDTTTREIHEAMLKWRPATPDGPT